MYRKLVENFDQNFVKFTARVCSLIVDGFVSVNGHSFKATLFGLLG